MLRFVSCLVLLAGCIADPDASPTAGQSPDGGDFDVPDAMPDAGADAMPDPLPPIADIDRNERFAVAAIRPSCTADQRPAVSLTLAQDPICAVESNRPDRVMIFIDDAPALSWPLRGPVRIPVAPDTFARGLYFNDRNVALPLSGHVLVERFSVHGMTYGRYVLQSSEGHLLEGAFESEFCAARDGIPDCYPYDEGNPFDVSDDPIVPEPIVRGEHCEGRYTLEQWVVTELGFRAHYINDMLRSGLMDGSLIVDVLARVDSVELIDVTPDAAGVRLRSPEVPPFNAIPIEWDADDGFETIEEGRFGIWLASSDYNDFEPLVWVLEQTRLEATSADDCTTLSITHTGAFLDLGYTIPDAKDADLDGDGVNDGWYITSQMTARRL